MEEGSEPKQITTMKLSELSLADLFALRNHFEKSGRIQHLFGLDNKEVSFFEPDDKRYYLVIEEIERRLNLIEE